MHQENNKIEYFKGEFLHPSLDIKNDVLILGFRFISKDLKTKNVFVVANNEKIVLLQDKYFDLGARKYFIELEERLLARIEEKWDLGKLINFMDDYNLAKVKNPSIKEVFEETKNLLKKYVELEIEEDYSLISAWAIGTYFFVIFFAYPFLHFKAPKDSGKTQCLGFLKQVCFNGIKAKPTFPALTDTVDSLRGTYLIDQADLLKRKGNEELIDILTDSYKREGGKRRMRFPEKQRGWKTGEKEAYSPKVYASIGELPEDLADRCITIPLIKSWKNFPQPSEENDSWKKIRSNFYKILIANFQVIKNTYDILKIQYRQNSKIIGRDLELWLPLEVILKYCLEEDKLNQVKKRFSQLYGYTEYEPNELEKEIIKNVYESFDDSEEKKLIRPVEIREKITNEDLWEEKYLTSHQKDILIGYVIKKFNLSSEKKKTNKGVAYLFEKEKVLKIKNLYCKDIENTSHSSPLPEDSKILTEKGVINNEDLKNSNTSP